MLSTCCVSPVLPGASPFGCMSALAAGGRRLEKDTLTGQRLAPKLPEDIWDRIAKDHFCVTEWLRHCGGTCHVMQDLQWPILAAGSRRGAWRSALKFVSRRWQAAQDVSLFIKIAEPVHKKALVRILGAGDKPPEESCSFSADLQDKYPTWLPNGIRSAAPSIAFDELVDFVLSHIAARLESLTLFLPPKHAPLHEMGRLQHLTLQLGSTFAGFKLLGMPELRSIVFVYGNNTKDDCIGPMHLTGLERLQSLYLGNVVPTVLSLPPGCALHLHCSTRAGSTVIGKHEWDHALGHLYSMCKRLPGAVLRPHTNVFLPQHGVASLTALTIVSSWKVNLGTRGMPISLELLPALQRLVLDIAGNMCIAIPQHVHLKRLWARRLSSLHVRVGSARDFVEHIEAMRFDDETYNSEDWVEVTAALEECGTPLVARQLQPAGIPTHVIQGCMYDVEAEGKPACACQICLDCLVRRICRPSKLPAALERPLF